MKADRFESPGVRRAERAIESRSGADWGRVAAERRVGQESVLFIPLGRWAISQVEYVLDLFKFLVRTLAQIGRKEGTDVVRKTTMYQIYFTGVDAAWVVSGLAVILGGLIIWQSLSLLAITTNEEFLGKVMELVVIRELGPIMTAFIVIGRSASSITVELGNMVVDREVQLLRSMGISPHRYLVLPRMLGVTSAIFCLCLIFDFVAVLGGFVVARLAISMPFWSYLNIVAANLTLTDIAVSGLKTAVFGVIIATVSTYQGLTVQHAVTEVPQATRRCVIHSLVMLLIADVVMAFVFFGLI